MSSDFTGHTGKAGFSEVQCEKTSRGKISGAQKGKEPFLFPESFPFLRKGKGKLYIFSGLERKGKGKVIFKRN